MNDQNTKMNAWHVTTDEFTLRRVGKLGEELGEATAVVCRIVIQGVDEVDPSSGETNRMRLQKELADVEAQIECTKRALGLDREFMRERKGWKIKRMDEWEDLLK